MDSDNRDAVFNRCIARLVTDGCPRDQIRTLFVPGRVEILGKHTDYCGGRSVTCAIDRGFHVAFAPAVSSPAAAPQISIMALDLNERHRFDFSPDVEPLLGTWANYPMSVARRLARNFDGERCGANIAFASTLPPAAGMSSSSALIVATFLALDGLNGFATRAKRADVITNAFELAEYLGTLENGQSYRSLSGDRGVGTFGGSEDHTAITLGRAGRFGVYGYSPTRLEREVAMPPGYVLAIASSGVVAEKTGAAKARYNRSALLVRQLVELWNEHTSGTATTLAQAIRGADDGAGQLRSLIRGHVADPAEALALLRRLDQFQTESESIIPTAMDALDASDLARFGEAVDRSQAAAEALLQNQVPQTQFLAAAARRLGAVAASSFGAGFGGSVWALIDGGGAEGFLSEWRSGYASAYASTSAGASFFTTRPIDGTHASLEPTRGSECGAQTQ